MYRNIDKIRPITLLNTDSKILARVFTNRLQIVASDQIRTELLRENRAKTTCIWCARLSDDNEATLIDLDLSKAFDSVDNWFLGDSNRCWICILYQCLAVVIQKNRKRPSKSNDLFGRAAPSTLCPHFGAPAPKV